MLTASFSFFPSLGIGINAGGTAKPFGNHHKVVVQLPMKYRIVDLGFPSRRGTEWCEKKVTVGPVLK